MPYPEGTITEGATVSGTFMVVYNRPTGHGDRMDSLGSDIIPREDSAINHADDKSQMFPETDLSVYEVEIVMKRRVAFFPRKY